MTAIADLEKIITETADDLTLLESSSEHRSAVEEAIELLDQGKIRMAEKADGAWRVNAWVQHAIRQYFRVAPFSTELAGPLEYHDRIPIKHGLKDRGIRVVAGSVVRYGSYIEPGVIVALGFVNLGAHVETGSLVDAWATVGSGAQIGRNVHLAGGVGIGGVLEPPGARPVIIEDNAFIGSRCIVVEGVIVEENAVVASHTCLTSSTHIIDVTGDEPVVYKGRVPANSVVVPGSRKRKFPAGEYEIDCALIIGQRTASTDGKVELTDDIRDFSFA
jgi:2,3,4,5-tetrahydropyridine-2,6-dicarboxylate N-succinyltransferase